MGKMIFSRKKSTFFFGDGMAGVSAGEVGKLRGGGARGGAVALLCGFFRGGRQRRRFRGCCTGGKKCVNLQVIVPGRFGARKMTQENISGHYRTRNDGQS